MPEIFRQIRNYLSKELPQGFTDASGSTTSVSSDLPDLNAFRPADALRVLIVDDVAMTRKIAGFFLHAAGHEVVYAEGGAEAVTDVTTAEFDVVLMDVRMPEMDGLEATRRIRALGGPHGHLPILALTVHVLAEQVEACRRAGMNGHISKPFDPDSLVADVIRASHKRTSRWTDC